MKRFLILTLIFFGLLISYQTLRVMNQQKYVAEVNVSQFKDKLLKIKAPDIFAEKNVIDTFKNRYKANLKFIFSKNDAEFFSKPTEDANLVIFPSFAYSSIIKNNSVYHPDNAKIPNLDKLMDTHISEIQKSFSSKTGFLALPVAYIPYAIYFDSQKIKPSVNGKEYFNKGYKIALSDDLGSMLAVARFLNLPFNNKLAESLKYYLKKDKTVFFNIDNLEEAINILNQSKPDIILAPTYLKAFFERRVGTLEMLLPEEGTYATYYLISIISDMDFNLSNVFLNHILDPLIQKNYSDTFNIPITNKVSLNTMAPVLYNSLKMNDPAYFSKMLILKDEKEYDLADSQFKKLKESF